ncbi:hypothetical protein DsansV1_C15g0135171 [Dioscorea sansibarensis]
MEMRREKYWSWVWRRVVVEWWREALRVKRGRRRTMGGRVKRRRRRSLMVVMMMMMMMMMNEICVLGGSGEGNGLWIGG